MIVYVNGVSSTLLFPLCSMNLYFGIAFEIDYTAYLVMPEFIAAN